MARRSLLRNHAEAALADGVGHGPDRLHRGDDDDGHDQHGEREAAELLGIPFDRYTQGGLFPIAYTKGTDFKPAERPAPDTILHWDTW